MIIIHEFGHFLVAKYFKVYVKEFSLFVGPKIFSKKFGETIYSLRTIPIAAYVKMEGEEEESESERSFNKKTIWQRALIIFGGPFANIFSAVIAIFLVFYISGTDTMKISNVLDGSPAEMAGVKVGDTLVEYAQKSTFTHIDFLTYTNIKPGEEAEIKVLRDDKIIPLKIKPIVDYKYYLIGVSFKEGKGTEIEDVREGYPAKTLGLLPRDIIKKVDGKEMFSYRDIKSTIEQKNGKPLIITYERAGIEMPSIEITPVEYVLKGVYAGVVFSKENLGIIDTLKYSVLFGYSNVKNVAHTVKWLILRDVKLDQLMGPVGIVASINSAVSQSINYTEVFLNLLGTFALISIAIGATNLIPFPALDGSKLLLLLVEAIRRKPIPVEKEAAISLVGLAVLMMFALFVTYTDINRVLSGFFSQ
jgi:regulator of sigma E protease